MEIKNFLVLISLFISILFLSGCSGSDIVITDVKVTDKKLEEDTFYYTIKIYIATDLELKEPKQIIVKISEPGESNYEREKEAIFLPGIKNIKISFSEKYTEYSNQENLYKIEIIDGTEVLDSKQMDVRYN